MVTNYGVWTEKGVHATFVRAKSVHVDQLSMLLQLMHTPPLYQPLHTACCYN